MRAWVLVVAAVAALTLAACADATPGDHRPVLIPPATLTP